MSFSLPLDIEGRQLGTIPVTLKGTEVNAVSLVSLKSILSTRVADDVWQALLENHSTTDDMVSLATLAKKGVNLVFLPSTLTLTVDISSEALGQFNVDFSEGFTPFSPSNSGSFSWLNSINFTHTESWQSSSNNSFSSADWLAQMNIGGASGLNITLANHLEADEDDTRVLRGEWTAFYDNPNAPLRMSIGDVESNSGSGVAGHLSSVSLGGLSIKSDYAELQPERIIGPNNNQELILKESAEVEISVNGQIIFSGRQEAGRFNLSNLPMANGANDIIVNVTYLSGKAERFVFSQFYNSSLLNQDMLNYAVTAGVPSIFADDGIEYLDTWTVAGFAEYGLLSWLTLGVNGSVAKYGQVLGTTATLGTDLGNLSSRLSFSNRENAGFGNILSFTFESTVLGTSNNQTPNLRLSAEFSDLFTSTPWDEEALATTYERYLANYVWVFNNQWDATISASYYKDNQDTKQSNLTFMLNWKVGNWTLGSGVSYQDTDTYDAADVEYFITLDWRRSNTRNRVNLAANYNSNNNHSQVELYQTSNDRVGSLGYRAQAEYEDGRESQNAQLNYTANRVRLEVEVERNKNSSNGSDAGYSASIRGNTAIGLVDGKLGWGRAQEGPFIVSQLHPSLSQQQVLLGTDQQDGYKAAGTPMIGGLLPLEVAYSNNIIDLNVPDAPIGYDWGESRITISPGAATGHYMMIGSDRSYTAKGILIDASGKPVSYLQGEIISEELQLPFFTNKSGRFYVQGVGPGKYMVTIADDRYHPLPVVVEQADSHLIELGTLNLACIKESCDENL
ncbi:fimbria/pilus outer membrane usher protein [Shewanella sp. D64]|uniref:fimbria/pilus outer membrane usher protein n=1 Tax=unclassified Shewanella TaxID=196818 RepID=UPI0022BA6A42|nr:MULTISPECIES: fimbria/pilus outer membrane usher protein [unclassified Shewanella]MEC4728538.1 fimbria/pilus outer membrane usher protein [Shewanella sp. D64]MEC4740542.1 fimbria/pilus outer membrane usher protein [Shewanella sp. E94]WBJ94263.1 fimbria/pilus outer membrane usher protein [Shewanella sp. MTB7]